jgi:hypothetical protein
MHLKCKKCEKQPPYFLEIIDWQCSRVDEYCDQISTENGSIRYECSVCGEEVEDED